MLSDHQIADVLRQLVTVEQGEKRALVSTPLLYPSGDTVTVRVTNGGPGFTVSDMALGYGEAESIGAANAYMRHVAPLAEDAGVYLHGRMILVSDITPDQLTGAVMAVANCSLAAAIIAADRHKEKEKADDVSKLVQRLERIFGRVEADGKISGSSTHKWNVDAIVSINGRVAVFDAVSSHPNSIYPTVTKFHDLALLEPQHRPVRFASVKAKADLGSLYGVLAQAGNVIERATPNEAVERLAHAA